MQSAKSIIVVTAAVVLGLFAAQAVAATDVNAGYHESAPPQAKSLTYFIQYPGTKHARRVYRFKALDRNHDGYLERSEIPGDMLFLRMHFNLADWNHDLKLSPQEVYLWEHDEGPIFVGTHPVFVYINRQR